MLQNYRFKKILFIVTDFSLKWIIENGIRCFLREENFVGSWPNSLPLVSIFYMNTCFKENWDVFDSMVTVFTGGKKVNEFRNSALGLFSCQDRENGKALSVIKQWPISIWDKGAHLMCAEFMWKGPHYIMDHCLVTLCNDVAACMPWNVLDPEDQFPHFTTLNEAKLWL